MSVLFLCVCVSSLHRLLFAVLPPPMGLVAVFFSVAFAQLSFSFSLIFVFHFQFVEHRIHWDFPLYLFFRFIYTHHQINNFILNSTECGSIHIRIYYLDIFKFIHSYLTRLGVILYIYKKNSVCFFSLSRSHTHSRFWLNCVWFTFITVYGCACYNPSNGIIVLQSSISVVLWIYIALIDTFSRFLLIIYWACKLRFSQHIHTHNSELWGGTRCVLFFFILAVLFFVFFRIAMFTFWWATPL